MMNIVKSDLVWVNAGDDRGKTGKVLSVFPQRSRVLVEGVNFVKRHTKPTQANRQGGIVEKERPIHLSNVMLFCPKCNRGTRVRHKRLSDERASKVRLCVNCEEVIPFP